MTENKKKDPAVEDKETVFIPRTSKNDDALFVSVNGRRILVRKGEPVQLPAPFAEVIRNAERAAEKAEAYIDAVGGRA